MIASPAGLLPIHDVTSANTNHQHTHNVVLNVADDPAIAYAIPPQRSHRSSQGSAQTPGVGSGRDPFLHVVDYTPGHLLVQPAQLIPGGFGIINRPGQGLALPNRQRIDTCLSATNTLENLNGEVIVLCIGLHSALDDLTKKHRFRSAGMRSQEIEALLEFG